MSSVYGYLIILLAMVGVIHQIRAVKIFRKYGISLKQRKRVPYTIVIDYNNYNIPEQMKKEMLLTSKITSYISLLLILGMVINWFFK